MHKRVLFSLAHPDDEAFGSGGLISKLVDEGVEVYYICGTNGAAGTVKPELIEQFGSIEAVRYTELDCASQVLGFKQVYKLGYGDSGMMNTPANQNPACLWQADETEVTGKIVQIMRELQPQIVITFDPFGGYGHPDHIFMHRATKRAFFAASDAAQFPDQGTVYQPQKLYYTGFPRTTLRFYIWRERLKGRNPRRVGVNKDLDLLHVLSKTLKPTTKINVLRYLDAWDKASQCHASQVSPRTGMPRWQRVIFSRKQALRRAYPDVEPGERLETDLFSGVSV